MLRCQVDQLVAPNDTETSDDNQYKINNNADVINTDIYYDIFCILYHYMFCDWCGNLVSGNSVGSVMLARQALRGCEITCLGNAASMSLIPVES